VEPLGTESLLQQKLFHHHCLDTQLHRNLGNQGFLCPLLAPYLHHFDPRKPHQSFGCSSPMNEPGSRAAPSFGCFSITIILPGLLPICTRSECLFVFLVCVVCVFPDPLLSDPLAFPPCFLPDALAGILLVSVIVLVHSSTLCVCWHTYLTQT